MLFRLISRPRLAFAVLAMATLGFAVLFAGQATKAPADFNDNTSCHGHIARGVADPDQPELVPVQYTFQCDGKITGYSIVTAPERQVQGAETEVFVTDGNGDVVPNDSFSCNGTFPGYGINCVAPAGSDYKTPGNFVSSQFTVDKKLCREPRLDPLLFVAYATVTKGQAVQSMAGPFDLGHAVSCPKPRHYKTHTPLKIPPDQDTVLTGQEPTRRR